MYWRGCGAGGRELVVGCIGVRGCGAGGRELVVGCIGGDVVPEVGSWW